MKHSNPEGDIQTSVASVLTNAIEHAETKSHTVLFQGEVRVEKTKFYTPRSVR